MYNRIVVFVDSSSPSRRALTYALDLALNTGAKLTALYVNQVIPFYFSALGPESRYYPLEYFDGENILNAMLSDMGIQSGFIRKKIATGNPVSLIVALATEERANLIVMGSRGYGLFTGLLLGSVSQSVIKHAPCSVLIVK